MTNNLKEKTAKGLLWGGVGNGVMQVASLVFGIFLSRLLSPSDYGMVGVLTIFSAIAGMFVEAGFITAIVNKKEARHEDYNAVFWFSLIMGLSLYIIMFLCAPLISYFFKIPELKNLSRYLFLGTIFSCLGTSPTAYYLRNLKVKERSIIQITAITGSGIIGVILAWMGFGYWGIATQTLAYILFSTAGIWILCPWKPTLKIDFSPLKEMFSFSSKLLLTTMFTHINNNVFSVLLGRFYNINQVGHYTQANKWTIMGYMSIVGMLNSVTQPVLREAMAENRNILSVFRKMLRFTVFISFPLMLGLGTVSEELITIAITDKWLQAAYIMHILCIGGAFFPITTLFSGLMNSLNKPQIYMWNTIALGLTQICCLIITYGFGFRTMLITYVSINILWIFIWRYFAGKYIGLKTRYFLADIIPYLLISLASVYTVFFIAGHISDIYVRLAFKIMASAAIYTGIMYLSGSVMFKDSINFLFKRKRNG